MTLRSNEKNDPEVKCNQMTQRSNNENDPKVKGGHMTLAEMHVLATRPQSRKPRQNGDQSNRDFFHVDF